MKKEMKKRTILEVKKSYRYFIGKGLPVDEVVVVEVIEKPTEENPQGNFPLFKVWSTNKKIKYGTFSNGFFKTAGYKLNKFKV